MRTSRYLILSSRPAKLHSSLIVRKIVELRSMQDACDCIASMRFGIRWRLAGFGSGLGASREPAAT